MRIRAVWSESSLGAFRKAKDAQSDLSIPQAHMSESTFSYVAAQLCILKL